MKNLKNVLISGGANGIGACLVKEFCEAGYSTAFIYKSDDASASKLAERYGAYPIKCDLSLSENAERAVEEVKYRLGHVDILINNAGISYVGLLTDMTDSEWNRLMNTNLSSAFFLTRAIVPDMVRRQEGRVINIGSVWGRCGASCEVAYSASKAAMRGFSMALAKELGPSGITVNCVEPGVIDTRMNSHFTEEDVRALIDETPVCRLGKAEDVAGLVLFLASDKASFITGQCIGVDGGFGL